MADNDDEPHPDMTPMIDVVFQLLVFFLVTMKFKTLDMKIEAFLPKDKGLAPTIQPIEEKPKLVVVLKRKQGEPVTRVKIANQTLGDTSKERAKRTWDQVTARAAEMKQKHLGAGGLLEDLSGEVDASHLVPTNDVIRAVDAFWRADITNVTFVGAPPPDSPLNAANRGQ